MKPELFTPEQRAEIAAMIAAAPAQQCGDDGPVTLAIDLSDKSDQSGIGEFNGRDWKLLSIDDLRQRGDLPWPPKTSDRAGARFRNIAVPLLAIGLAALLWLSAKKFRA